MATLSVRAIPAQAEAHSPAKPLALVIFLENVGHIAGVPLPAWVMNVIDFTTEEYAKVLLRVYGAWRRYDRVVLLEDALATGPRLVDALLSLSRTHRVDLLLLVHGHENRLVGHRGHQFVEADTFEALGAARRADPAALDLRMVFGLNCYGASLAPTWLALGAQVCNGAAGVNWLPEPSLSVFLRGWLGGLSYGEAVRRSHSAARQWGARVWPPRAGWGRTSEACEQPPSDLWRRRHYD